MSLKSKRDQCILDTVGRILKIQILYLFRLVKLAIYRGKVNLERQS